MSSDLHFLHLCLPRGVVNQPRGIGLTHADRVIGTPWHAAERGGVRKGGGKWKKGSNREEKGQIGEEEKVEGGGRRLRKVEKKGGRRRNELASLQSQPCKDAE